MKIKIEDTEIKRLQGLKESIEALMNSYTEDMDATEDNLNKIKNITDKINSFLPPHLDYDLLKIKMVNSAGTKFTIN